MSGRDPDAPIPADFQCDYAEPGERACPAWRCDCFVAQYPDDPFGLHPEAFIVVADHPGTDPGDGRTQCETCGKYVWPVTHSCKGIRVYPPSKD